MTNSKRLFAGWLLATAIALTLSWSAVAQVRNRVIEPAVAIPTTAATAATTTTTETQVIRLEDDSPPATTTLESPQTTTSSTSPPATTSTQPPESAPVETTTTAPPATSTSTAPDTATTTTSTTTTTTSTTTSTTTPPEWETSSHTLLGGVVTISATSGIVNFVAAVPQPGFSTETRETGPDRVRIRFESDNHTSDFRAEWQNGELEITLSETGGDD